MFVDTHLHLDFDHFDDDRDAVVARAVDAGVTQMITIGIDRETCRQAVALSERYDAVYAAVGIHPNSASEWNAEVEAEIRKYVRHPKVVAIGEIGLDYYWDRVSPDVQRQVFRAQLDVAAELQMPVIVHDREAHDDVLAVLIEWDEERQPARPVGVLHFFGGDSAMAQTAQERGWYFGVDGPVTYKNATELYTLAASLPFDRLLLETDAPFLTPAPHRGERNEPAYLRFVAEKVAALRDDVTVEEVARRTTANARIVFPKLTGG